jgi:hypothetical protein
VDMPYFARVFSGDRLSSTFSSSFRDCILFLV